MTPRVFTGDLLQLQDTLSKEFQAQAADAMTRHGTFVIALTGGSVGPAFFPMLATLPLGWSHTEIFWIDERAVPPDHPDSNYALASRLLLTPAHVPLSRIHRMPAELPDLDEAARRASDELKSIAGDPPRLDLALMGVGEDGHVASVFSRSAGLQPCLTPVIAVHDSPKPPPRRLTLTLPVLADAAAVIVIALGAAKADVMRDALHNPSAKTPIAELLRRARAPLVLLDQGAGLSLALPTTCAR